MLPINPLKLSQLNDNQRLAININFKLSIKLIQSVLITFALTSCLVQKADNSGETKIKPATKVIQGFGDINYSRETDINFKKTLSLTIQNYYKNSKYFRVYSSDTKGRTRLFFSGKTLSEVSIIEDQTFSLSLGTKFIIIETLDSNGDLVSSQKSRLKKKLKLRI